MGNIARKKTTLTTQGKVVTEQVPISDTQKTGWTEGAGDTDGDAFDELDEGVAAADDSTTFWTHTAPGTGAQNLKMKLTARDIPADPTKMDIRLQLRARVGNIATVTTKIFSPEGTLRFTEATALTTAEGWKVHRPNGTNNDLSSVTDWTDVHMLVENSEDTVGEILDCSMMSITQGA